MITIKRTTSDNTDFKKLSNLFDEFLIDIDGEERDFFAFFNNKFLEHVAVFYKNKIAVGCGGFKRYDSNTAEIKRMFVHPDHRNEGLAKIILQELENWVKEENFQNYILETSPKLEAAISLYLKFGYSFIPNYGQYIGVENSICMRKNSNQ